MTENTTERFKTRILFFLVNLKRSKSAPGLIEASCRHPFHAPVRRTGSGIQRLSSIKESDMKTIVPLDSSNPFSATAPLASSISITSSSNSCSILSNEIEQLKKSLIELEQENFSSNPILKQRYIEIENRLKILLSKSNEK
jgi:hypothetical protein